MAQKFDCKFANEIASISFEKFNCLGKSGMPKHNQEWTLLSCFIKRDNSIDKTCLEVVALGTGSKCLGKSQLPKDGDVLHDSHAEVVARRAFVLYLLGEVENLLLEQKSIFTLSDSKAHLRDGISFHFFTSHTPCGDASIFPKQDWQGLHGTCLGSLEELNVVNQKNIRVHNSDAENHKEPAFKKAKFLVKDEESTLHSSKSQLISETLLQNMEAKLINDVYRTGAKCVPGELEDPKGDGENYHVVGVLRTKPGRGDSTLSMSCSDKVLRWTILGVQGALPMLFLDKPVYMETIIIGNCPYDQNVLERALIERYKVDLESIKLPNGFKVTPPTIIKSEQEFKFSRRCVQTLSGKVMPSSTSIIWSKSSDHDNQHEVSTNGRRLGATTKSFGTANSRVKICRKEILQKVIYLQFLSSAKINKGINICLKKKSYSEVKSLSESYAVAWETLRAILKNWTIKPLSINNFEA